MIQKLAMFALVMLASSVAFAAEGTSDMRYLGVAFGIGAAVLGGALGQAKVAAAAARRTAWHPAGRAAPPRRERGPGLGEHVSQKRRSSSWRDVKTLK